MLLTIVMKPIEIRILLLRAGKSQSEIARELGVTQGFIAQVILGLRKTQYVQEAIAKAVGKRVESLWSRSNHKRKAA